MPRQPRFVLPGYPQHVIQRGNNRRPIFLDNKDYETFSEYLMDACDQYECRIHAYVWMTNHIHLLLTPDTKEGISKAMQSLGRKYVQYFNRKYKRTGTLWEGRYKATIIDSENYLFACYRYIELNPVRANMVSHPREYYWSSYHANALGKSDEIVQVHDEYRALGKDLKSRTIAYKQLFENGLNERFVKEIGETTQKCWALGSDQFKHKISGLVSRQISPTQRGGRRQ